MASLTERPRPTTDCWSGREREVRKPRLVRMPERFSGKSTAPKPSASTAVGAATPYSGASWLLTNDLRDVASSDTGAPLHSRLLMNNWLSRAIELRTFVLNTSAG